MMNPHRSHRLRASFAPVFLTLLVSTAPAAVLVEYDFASASPTTSAPGITGSAAAWWSTTATGFGGAAQSAFTRADNLGTTFDSGKYLTLTLTAAGGQVMNLQSFSFDLGGGVASSAVGTGSSVIVSSEVRASVGETAYATPLSLSTPGVTTATHTILNTDGTATYTRYTVDLSGADFQDAESVSLRLYVASSGSSATRFLRFDNFSFEGTIADASSVPEPSAAACIAGVMALGFVACKRRRFK